MTHGYIYIMTNPAHTDMVKIGYAKNVKQRRKPLSTTVLLYEYEIYVRPSPLRILLTKYFTAL